MSEEYERARRARLAEINEAPKDADALRAAHGEVWDTDGLRRDYEVIGFAAPFVVVRRRADGVVGSLEFQHEPRLYFAFAPDVPESSGACSWCHAGVASGVSLCPFCRHMAHRPRLHCSCPRCAREAQPRPLTPDDIDAAIDGLRRRGG
jgi:hypothetical protein